MALVFFLLGLVLLVLPIPSSVFFFMASGALLASESLSVARFLDQTELRLRAWAQFGVSRWRRMLPAHPPSNPGNTRGAPRGAPRVT